MLNQQQQQQHQRQRQQKRRARNGKTELTCERKERGGIFDRIILQKKAVEKSKLDANSTAVNGVQLSQRTVVFGTWCEDKWGFLNLVWRRSEDHEHHSEKKASLLWFHSRRKRVA